MRELECKRACVHACTFECALLGMYAVRVCVCVCTAECVRVVVKLCGAHAQLQPKSREQGPERVLGGDCNAARTLPGRLPFRDEHWKSVEMVLHMTTPNFIRFESSTC